MRKNLDALSWFEIALAPREANAEADALAHLASGIDEKGEWSIPIEVLTCLTSRADERVGRIPQAKDRT